MSDFKDRMIEAYEHGECSYEGSYDYARESMAEGADLVRKAAKENPETARWVDPFGGEQLAARLESILAATLEMQGRVDPGTARILRGAADYLKAALNRIYD